MKPFFSILIMCLSTSLLLAQNIQKSSLGSSGNSTIISVGENSYYVSQSIGQNSVIGTFRNNNYAIRQGFQQPPIQAKIIVKFSKNIDATIYPNPVDTNITVVLKDVIESPMNMIISDMQGKVVFSQTLNSVETFQINMSFLSSGTYFFRLNAENKFFLAKLIKK